MSVIFHDQIVSPNLPKVKIASSTRVNLSKPKKFDAHLNDKNKSNWSTQFTNIIDNSKNMNNKHEMIDIKKVMEMKKMKHNAK